MNHSCRGCVQGFHWPFAWTAVQPKDFKNHKKRWHINTDARTSLKRNTARKENVVEAKPIGNKSVIECEEFSALYNVTTQRSVNLNSTSSTPILLFPSGSLKRRPIKASLFSGVKIKCTPEGVVKWMSSCKQNRLPRKNKLQRKPWLSSCYYSLMRKSFNASVCGASLSCGVRSIPYCKSCAGSEPLDWHFEGISIKDFWLIPSDLRLEPR